MKPHTRNILIAILVILLFVGLWYIKHVVFYFLLAIVVSIIGKPILKILTKVKFKYFSINQTFASIIVLLLLWVFIGMFLLLLIPLIVNEAKIIASIDVNNIVEVLHTPINYIKDLFIILDSYGIEGFSEQFLIDKVRSLVQISNIASIISTTTSIIGDIFIAIFSVSFISFFFLKENTLKTKIIYLAIPTKYTEQIRSTLYSINHLLTRYFIGVCIEVFLVMIIITFGLRIVGIGFEHAIVIGFVAGMLNVIPYLGPILGMAFGLFVSIALSLGGFVDIPIFLLLGKVFAIFISCQLLDNILFQPYIYSNSVKAHPLEIFAVILIAGSIVGIVGMILAIPTYTVLRVIAREFFNNHKIIKELTKKI